MAARVARGRLCASARRTRAAMAVVLRAIFCGLRGLSGVLDGWRGRHDALYRSFRWRCTPSAKHAAPGVPAGLNHSCQ